MKLHYSKKYTVLLPLLMLQFALSANETSASKVKGEPGIYEWAYHNILFIIAGMVIITALGAIFNLYNKLMEIQKIRLMQELGIEAVEQVNLMDTEPLWKKWYKSMTKVVPIEKEKDVLLDHDYDGIKELDNVLPPWWVATFYITIVAGIAYYGIWHFSDYGYSSAEGYVLQMEEAEEQVKEYLANQADLVDETNVELLTDESAVAMGATIFDTKCITCHGKMGEGNSIGPNLTDEYWLHGGSINDVFKTIKYGVPEKGMISWKSQLRPADIQRIASYIMSIQGTNPPNAKAPQGELYTKENKDSEQFQGQIGMN